MPLPFCVQKITFFSSHKKEFTSFVESGINIIGEISYANQSTYFRSKHALLA